MKLPITILVFIKFPTNFHFLRPEPKDLENRLDTMIDIIRQERNLGYISLFTRSGLAIKTFNVTIALVASNFVYYQVKPPEKQ